jgi:hypothetical protein
MAADPAFRPNDLMDHAVVAARRRCCWGPRGASCAGATCFSYLPGGVKDSHRRWRRPSLQYPIELQTDVKEPE